MGKIIHLRVLGYKTIIETLRHGFKCAKSVEKCPLKNPKMYISYVTMTLTTHML